MILRLVVRDTRYGSGNDGIVCFYPFDPEKGAIGLDLKTTHNITVVVEPVAETVESEKIRRDEETAELKKEIEGKVKAL